MTDLRSHVGEERKRRGLSVRAAAHSGGISNTTWGTFEDTGKVTDGVRRGVARAFGWSTTWPEVPPALTRPDPTEPSNAELMAKIDVLTVLVQNMGVVVEQIATQALGPTRPVDPTTPTSPRSSVDQ